MKEVVGKCSMWFFGFPKLEMLLMAPGPGERVAFVFGRSTVKQEIAEKPPRQDAKKTQLLRKIAKKCQRRHVSWKSQFLLRFPAFPCNIAS